MRNLFFFPDIFVKGFVHDILVEVVCVSIIIYLIESVHPFIVAAALWVFDRRVEVEMEEFVLPELPPDCCQIVELVPTADFEASGNL